MAFQEHTTGVKTSDSDLFNIFEENFTSKLLNPAVSSRLTPLGFKWTQVGKNSRWNNPCSHTYKGWDMPGAEQLGLHIKPDLIIESLIVPEVKVLEEVVRPEGYAISGLKCFHVLIEGSGLTAEGWGTGTNELAPVKAYSEALERFCMFSQVANGRAISSSNGWAAHTDMNKAKVNAVAELVERDTALRSWFNAGPYYDVPRDLWPKILTGWESSISVKNIEFAKPKVLLSAGPFGACISVLLQTKDERTVAGHASGMDLGSSIESAFFEALRSAHAALRFEDFAETADLHSEESPTLIFGPGANGMAYAYDVKLPSLQIVTASEIVVQSSWQNHQQQLLDLESTALFSNYKIADRYIVHAKLNGLQDIFWGRTPQNMDVKNKFPHFVG